MSADKKKKKNNRRFGGVFVAVLFTFLTLFVLFSLAAATVIVFLFNSTSSGKGLYSVSLRVDNKKVSTVSAANANNAYGLYVPYSKICDIADISIVGNDERMTLICLPSGGTVTCNIDSTLIYVNGSAARLSVPVMYQGGDWLLPTEIFENYIFGFDVTFDEKSKVCIISRNRSSDLSLKMAGTNEMECPYFPESYKYYH